MFQEFTIISKCHRNVSKQTNPLQVNDAITNLESLKASRRILDTQYVKSSVLANMKIF